MKGAQRSNLRLPTNGRNLAHKSEILEKDIEHLLAHEVDTMKEQFFIFDKSNSGFIQPHELRILLDYCGEKPNEDKLGEIDTWLEGKGIKRLDIGACL